jgi:hypothetical protein
VRELRQRFNEGRYWQRLQVGEFRAVVQDDRHPSLPKADEPYCKRSQLVSYRDAEDQEVARVHQYLRTDGTLGASGRPDPKRLLEEGTVYCAESPRKG